MAFLSAVFQFQLAQRTILRSHSRQRELGWHSPSLGPNLWPGCLWDRYHLWDSELQLGTRVMWHLVWTSEAVSSQGMIKMFPLEGDVSTWWHAYDRSTGHWQKREQPRRVTRAGALSVRPWEGAIAAISGCSKDHFWPVLSHYQGQRRLGSSVGYDSERDWVRDADSIHSIFINSINIVFSVHNAVTSPTLYPYVRLESPQKCRQSLREKGFDQK